MAASIAANDTANSLRNYTTSGDAYSSKNAAALPPP
jgi:hypothetical protein